MCEPIQTCIATSLLRECFLDLVRQAQADSARWFQRGTGTDLKHLALALCGEAGELANIVKKVDRGTLALEEATPMIRKELADILTYYFCLCGVVRGADPLTDYLDKRMFNEKRFGHV